MLRQLIRPLKIRKTSSGKGCAKTGCGCLVVFVVLFILIGLFGGSSSDSDSDKKPSSSDAASVTATSEMSVASSEAEEVKPEEELCFTHWKTLKKPAVHTASRKILIIKIL